MQYLLGVLKSWYTLVAALVTQDGTADFTQSIPLPKSMNGVYVPRLDYKAGESSR